MAELSVSFVTAQEIQRLNKKFRNLDKPTDVLSFPLSEPEEWQKTTEEICEKTSKTIRKSNKFGRKSGKNGKPPKIRVNLGDIIVCTEIAEQQAHEYGHSLERELSFLVIHGLLHLTGYNHETPAAEQAMRQMQRNILGEVL